MRSLGKRFRSEVWYSLMDEIGKHADYRAKSRAYDMEELTLQRVRTCVTFPVLEKLERETNAIC